MTLFKGLTCINDAFSLIRGGASTCSTDVRSKFSFESGAHEGEVKSNVSLKFSLVCEHASAS